MSEMIDLSKPKNSLKEFDPAGLWEKHSFLDLNAGEITMIVPVDLNRTRDLTRQPKFFSSINASRRGQPFQLPFEIVGALTLEDAVRLWLEFANAEADKFHAKAEEAEIRSRLAVPASARMTQPN